VQIVEDILTHAEEVAIAEGGPLGEVTLLRLLKVHTSHLEQSFFLPPCRSRVCTARV